MNLKDKGKGKKSKAKNFAKKVPKNKVVPRMAKKISIEEKNEKVRVSNEEISLNSKKNYDKKLTIDSKKFNLESSLEDISLEDKNKAKKLDLEKKKPKI